jgi:DNA-binding response OmpR family regulator
LANILIVSDDEALRDLLELSLVRLGHGVEMTDSGSRALDLIRDEVFDALILDNSFLEMTALDILKHPRGKRDSIGSVIVLNSEWTPETIKEFAGAGAAELVTKPFNLPDLLIRIEKLSGRA